MDRCFQVGRGANARYLEALAQAGDQREGVAALDRHCRPIRNRCRRHARLNPIAKPDLALFRAVLAGEHAINGFRNADVRHRLWPDHSSPPRRRGAAAPGPHGSSPSFAVTGSSPKSPAAASIA